MRLEVAALLGRHREKHHPPRQVGEGVGVEQPHGGTQHGRDLSVVTTGVGGSRVRIALGMARHDQRVKLADQRQGGAVPGASRAPRPVRR